MAIYHYKDASLIDSIEVKSPRMGITHATIIAKDNVSADDLEKLRQQLGAYKFSTLMDTVDGHAAIQVRGLKTEKPLFTALGKIGLVHSHVVKEAEDGDNRKMGYRDRVRGKSLFLSSLFYDLGNIAFIASGIQRGRHNIGGKFTSNDKSEIMIGVAFSLGDVLMTGYSGDKGDEELKAAAASLKRHLHSKGIDLPRGDALNPDTLHQSGALKAIDRWLHRHIIQVKCLTELAGGLFTIHSALKPGNRNNGKLAAGLLISTGWLTTFLLEKPRGHKIFQHTKDDPNIIDKIKDNPRGWIGRPFGMANNVSNLWGSLNTKDGERTRFKTEVVQARKAVGVENTLANQAHLAYTLGKQHDYGWNVLSACAFLIAHSLFGLSGAKRPQDTADDKSMMDDLVLLSANVLAKQPDATREEAIKDTALYVSKLNHVTLGTEVIAQAIHEKIMAIHHTNWVSRVPQEPLKNQRNI